MNFLLLVSILVINFFSLYAMEQPFLPEVESLEQQVQNIQRPFLKDKITRYLEIAPQPAKMDRQMFENIRKLCIKAKYAPILQALLQQKNGVRIIDPNSKYKTDSGRVFRLLSEAVFNRAYANVTVLLNAGANPNAAACNFQDHYSLRESPLYTAADFFDLPLLQLLFDAGANPNQRYRIYDNLPLTRIVSNYVEADEDDRDRDTTISMILLFLDHFANPDEKDKDGCFYLKNQADMKKYYTARELAQAAGCSEILTLLNRNTPQ